MYIHMYNHTGAKYYIVLSSSSTVVFYSRDWPKNNIKLYMLPIPIFTWKPTETQGYPLDTMEPVVC